MHSIKHYLHLLKTKQMYGFPLWAVLLVALFIILTASAFIKDFVDARSLPSSENNSSDYSFASSMPSTSSTPQSSSTPSGKATAKPSASASPKASATPSPTPSPTSTPAPTTAPTPTPTPAPDKPKCIASSIPPSSGPAPLTVFLHGSGQGQGSSNLVGYQWDYEGNGSWDSDVKLDAIQHTYTTAGQYTPKYRILGTNDQWSDTCTYPFSITVTAPN